jgi:hypothetical protein
VNCFVTTNAYPFENTTTTTVPWSGAGTVFFADASSDRNGRDNTADIASTGTSAVQLCKDLGMGWYLPAYEELVNMSRGVSYSPLNGLSGAGVLTGSYHWSSTEYYENGGRYTSAVTSFQQRAVQVYPDGDMSNALKTNNYSIRCAWWF